MRESRDSKRAFRKSGRTHASILLAGVAALAAVLVMAPAASAEDKWQADVDVKKTVPAPPPVIPDTPSAKTAKPPAKNSPSNTTVIEREGTAAGGARLKLVALLTDDGQQIDQGLVWRVFHASLDAAGKSKLVTENREAAPALKLPPGDYTINASFGRANLTRKITVKAGDSATEQFVLNAGGLRINASASGKPAAQGMVSYSIYSDDRDQFANRTAIMTNAKPGLIIRLNAGIYHIVSTYGDANASIEADVTVEAGKLTEATIAHTAGKATFKLVTRAGGEALPDTHWSIQTADGSSTIKESVGALPSHFLAPGEYLVMAKSAGNVFKRKFTVKAGETANVEVVMDGQQSAPAVPAAATETTAIVPPELEGMEPSLEIKNP